MGPIEKRTIRTTGTAQIPSAASRAARTINGTRSDRGDATAPGWRRRSERSAGYLRCRILDRMRRFLRPILRRHFPVFLLPTQCSVRLFGGSRYCGKTDQPARGPSILIGRVPGAACLHAAPESSPQTVPSISESYRGRQQVVLRLAGLPLTLRESGPDARVENGGAQSSTGSQPSASEMAWRMRISRTLGSYGLRTK